MVKWLSAVGILAGFCIITCGVANSQVPQESAPKTSPTLKYVVDASLPIQPSFRKLSHETPPGYDVSSILASLGKAGAGAMINDRVVLAHTVFGATNSRSIAFAVNLDQTNLLRVDLDRDGKFSDSETVTAQTDGTWLVGLKSEFPIGDGNFEHIECQVVCKLSKTGTGLLLSTVGCFKGHVNLGKKSVDLIRSDFNSNGRWSDKQDRFLLDANDDGKFSLLHERFGFSPICRIGQDIFRVGGDERGGSFTMEPSLGSGTLEPEIKLADPNAKINAFSATLVSNAGVHVYLKNQAESVSLPIGSYYVDKLTLELSSANGILTMDFAHLPGANADSIEVTLDQSKKFNPLGDLKLSASTASIDDKGRVNLVINPMVSTSSGCYLVNSRIDDRKGEFNSAKAEAWYNEQPFAVHRSGFV